MKTIHATTSLISLVFSTYLFRGQPILQPGTHYNWHTNIYHCGNVNVSIMSQHGKQQTDGPID